MNKAPLAGRRVLLVGTSFSAAPMLQALKRMGCHVSVCGDKPNDPCVAYADTYHRLDYSDPAALLDLARAESFDHLCPSCNDYSYLAATEVAAAMGFSGYDAPDTAALLHNKAKFRAFTEKHAIPAPRARRVDEDSAPATIDFPPPWLVKPADSFSGRGMVKLHDKSALAAAVARGHGESRNREVLVEEFMPGSLHSHSAFLRSGEIVDDFFVDEFCQVYPYQVDCSNSPSRLSAGLCAEIRDCIRTIAGLLGLADGLLHTQFLADGNHFAIIECMRRCPGDLYYHLVSYSTGANYVDNYLAPFIGRPIVPTRAAPPIPWARHTVSLPDDAVFVSFAQRIPSPELRVFPLCESANAVRRAPYGKIAIIFARFADTPTLFATTPAIGQLITIDTLDIPHAPAR